MFNREIFHEALAAYKRDFDAFQWEYERFKWEAVKCFQDNWDLQAEDLPFMLKRAFRKTSNLLGSMGNFPRETIIQFATAAPEAVRAAFTHLFDESEDLIERVEHFKAQAERLLAEYGDGAKNHSQHENAISTYLWLRYPDKYYIYKYSEVRTISKLLVSDYPFKKGAYAANLRNSIGLYDEICAELRQDAELRDMLNAHLDENCYPDPELRTLAIDVGFYISRYYSDQVEKTTYLSEITEALKALGGTGHLSDICHVMEERDKLPAIKTNPAWESAVRAAIQSHCSETQSYKEGNSDLFYSVHGIGQGVWGLRAYADASTSSISVDPPVSQQDPETSTEDDPKAYDRSQFLQEVYMSGENFDTLCTLLRHKKNLILQGAPGVGKTFAAKRLAYAMMGAKDDSRVEFVQFHQSYSYEDFIMGYKPSDSGFKLEEGIFYEFCVRASEDPGRDYFFIIDEINRGNVSKIFGELLMLIEKDYRNTSAKLAYSKHSFSVPGNLYLIGMMNTADRSLAIIDYALRRRFSIFEMEPAFDSEGFSAYQSALSNETFDSLIDCVRELNRDIRNDASLGRGFCIGHSYFCNQTECTEEWMKAVAYYDILPMLREYWFDNSDRVDHWESRLRGVFE